MEANGCRAKAKEMTRKANEATDPTTRHGYLALAEMWLKIASLRDPAVKSDALAERMVRNAKTAL
jgi:hypothetical protein